MRAVLVLVPVVVVEMIFVLGHHVVAVGDFRRIKNK